MLHICLIPFLVLLKLSYKNFLCNWFICWGYYRQLELNLWNTHKNIDENSKNTTALPLMFFGISFHTLEVFFRHSGFSTHYCNMHPTELNIMLLLTVRHLGPNISPNKSQFNITKLSELKSRIFLMKINKISLLKATC